MRAKGKKGNGELGRRGKIAVSWKWNIADAGGKEMTIVVVAF
jgi:hypothetical protein